MNDSSDKTGPVASGEKELPQQPVQPSTKENLEDVPALSSIWNNDMITLMLHETKYRCFFKSVSCCEPTKRGLAINSLIEKK